MTRQFNPLPLFFVCWLAYFTVPVINNIGVFNGVYVMLCATKGVMIHSAPTSLDSFHLSHLDPLDPHAHHKMSSHAGHQMSQHANHHAHHMGADDAGSTDLSMEDHEAEGCPCIHFFFDTTLRLSTINAFVKASQPVVDDSHTSPITTLYTVHARGPPKYYRYSYFLEQHT